VDNRPVLLAVDVGNTQTHIGAFDGGEIVHRWRLTTEPAATADELAATTATLFRLGGVDPGGLDGAIVSTVVPRLGPEYEQLCEHHLGASCLLVGPNVKTGMPIRVDNPHELGADRLVNAVAAHAAADGAVVAVDFGTSTNFDVVSAGGEYLGGVIGPGVEISLEALTSRTAKLPRIDIADPQSAIGHNTQAAMESGFAYGFAGLVDGINRRIEAELAADEAGQPEFIATGGLSGAIAPHCETIDRVDEQLTLTGLRLIWELNT
jgi:type III pantothenate kinase